MTAPLLSVRGLTKHYGARTGCDEVSLDVFPGEVLAIVGESGSGKTTLLNCISGRMQATSGSVRYAMRDGTVRELADLSEAERRLLMRTDWGFVHQNPADGLRMRVSAGANVGERLMARRRAPLRRASAAPPSTGSGASRSRADRIDDQPVAFSGGMRQRLQIARNLVTRPRLVFMDEPTGGLDVSVQARLLDLLRSLVAEMGLAGVVVTHDLAVARLLSQRMVVMKGGRVIETGPDRPGPRRPAPRLHPAPRLLDPGGLSHGRADPAAFRRASRQVLHHASARRHPPAGRRPRGSFTVAAGECVVLGGPSGVGKSSHPARWSTATTPSTAAPIRVTDHCDGRDDRPRLRRPRADHRASPHADRLCQPVPARRAAGAGARTSSPSR